MKIVSMKCPECNAAVNPPADKNTVTAPIAVLCILSMTVQNE